MRVLSLDPVKSIQLTQGKTALISLEDYELAMTVKWHAVKTRNGRWYAASTYRDSEGKVRKVYMHNFVMEAVGIDHINANGLDNRRENLRLASQTQNNANRRKTRGESRFKGVTRNLPAQNWKARIGINGKKFHIGCFETEEKAAKAYNLEAIRLFGKYARLNQL